MSAEVDGHRYCYAFPAKKAKPEENFYSLFEVDDDNDSDVSDSE